MSKVQCDRHSKEQKTECGSEFTFKQQLCDLEQVSYSLTVKFLIIKYLLRGYCEGD